MQRRHICAQSESERAASSPGVLPVGPCMYCLSFPSRSRRPGYRYPYTCIVTVLSLLESRAAPAKKKRGFTQLIRRIFRRSQPPRFPRPLRGAKLSCFFPCVFRVPRSPAKSREVPRSPAKSRDAHRPRLFRERPHLGHSIVSSL
jgi:hypothetical protein